MIQDNDAGSSREASSPADAKLKNRASSSRATPARELASPEELQQLRQQLCAQGLLERVAYLADIEDGLEPKRIGRFIIQNRLGSGSYGTVYMAWDPAMSRRVAIKLAHGGGRSTKHMRNCFLAEAHAAARMAHPNVVTVHEYGEEGGLLYIVFQLCEGPSLAEWMAEHPDRTAASTAVEIIRQLAQGLAHAHQCGIVHRDIKPGNVLLEAREPVQRAVDGATFAYSARLTDFGLAHNSGSPEDLADSGGLQGTIDYMSPEQVQGLEQANTAASDIYSLGVLFYRLLTGELPSQGDNPLEILNRICTTPPVPPRYWNPSIPKDLAAVCLKCLEKRPADRYTDCQQLIADLDRWRAGDAVSVRPRSTLEQAWHNVKNAPVIYALSAIVLLLSVSSSLILYIFSNALVETNREQSRLLSVSVASQQVAAAARAAAESAEREAFFERDKANELFMETLRTSYQSAMHLAYELFDQGQWLAAEETLNRIHHHTHDYVPLRFDYHLLRASLVGGPQRLSSHAETANGVLPIPHSELIASFGDDGQVVFQHDTTGEIEYTFTAEHRLRPTAMSVDAAGSCVAIAFSGPGPGGFYVSMVEVFDLDRSRAGEWLKQRPQVYAAPSTVQSLCFSPDGERLAIGPRYYPVSIRNLTNGSLTVVSTDSRNRTLQFSPDGHRLLVLQKESRMVIADADSGQVLTSIDCEGVPQVAAWSPNGKWLAYSCHESSQVHITAAEQAAPTLVQAVQAHGIVETLRFDAADHLVAGTKSGAIVTWNLACPLHAWPDDKVLSAAHAGANPELQHIEAHRAVQPHAGCVTGTGILRDGRVASTDDTGAVVVSHYATNCPTLVNETPTVMRCVDGGLQTPGQCQTLIAGFARGEVKLIDGHGKVLREILAAQGSEVSALAVDPQANRLAVGWENGRIVLLKVGEAYVQVQEVGYLPPRDSLDERRITSLSFSPDGRQLAACGTDARVRTWSVQASAQPLWERVMTSQAFSVCFVGNQQVACGGIFEEILVFDAQRGKRLASLGGTQRAGCLLYDAQRHLLVSGHADGRLRIHQAADWKLIHTMGSSIGGITSLQLSPCREFYLTGSQHGRLDLWEAGSNFFVGTVREFRDRRAITAIEVSPDLELLTLSPSPLQADVDVGIVPPGLANLTSLVR